MITSLNMQDTEMLESAFNALDKNNDGYLNYYELSECLMYNSKDFDQIRGLEFAESMKQFIEENDEKED